jgi:hypothetical protein
MTFGPFVELSLIIAPSPTRTPRVKLIRSFRTKKSLYSPEQYRMNWNR